MPSKKDLTMDDNINAERRRLNRIFKNIEINKKAVNQELIVNAAFMAVTLRRLQDQIKKEGAVITSVNGNGFETINEHPAQKSYNTMINRYTMAIKHLTEIISKEPPKESRDDLLEFLKE